MTLVLRKIHKPSKVVGQIKLRIAVEDSSEEADSDGETDTETRAMTDAIATANSALSKIVVGPKAVDSLGDGSDKVQSATDPVESASDLLSNIGPWNDLIEHIKSFDASAIVKAVDAAAEVRTLLSNMFSTTKA
jgi:hypothetical protein